MLADGFAEHTSADGAANSADNAADGSPGDSSNTAEKCANTAADGCARFCARKTTCQSAARTADGRPHAVGVFAFDFLLPHRGVTITHHARCDTIKVPRINLIYEVAFY